MELIRRLIRSVLILTLLLTARSGICRNATLPDTLNDKQKKEAISMLPTINRDLQICDLVKEQNGLLKIENKILEGDVIRERSDKETAQKQTRKEKRKRIITNVVRTVLEVSIIVLIVIL